jgi:putative flippase GtrA
LGLALTSHFLRHRRRFFFPFVGGVCFLAQVAILSMLSGLGTPEPAANAAGFLISAQLNYVLSARLTWGDRRARRSSGLIAYNGTALVSLGVNTVVFTAVYRLTGTTVAAALGVLGGMGVTYAICDRFIFRRRRIRAAAAVHPVPELERAAS